LIGTPEAKNDPAVRDALLRRKDNEGFEAALSDMHGAYLQNRGSREKQSLDRLKSAINSMFSDMDQGFAAQDFEFQSDTAYMVRTLLIQFDAICSLNQDCLPELHYLNDDFQLGSMGRWDGWQIPGMQQIPDPSRDPLAKMPPSWTPESQRTDLRARYQLFVKLRGSHN
jgi:hypothetical protein